MTEYTIDLTGVTTRDGLIAAFNDGFIRQFGGEWNGHLDAFNDYLYWPYEPGKTRYRLVIIGWPACAADLCDVRIWDGRPLPDVLMEILQDEDNREYLELALR